METNCKVCGGNHKTGACVENKKRIEAIPPLVFPKFAERFLGKQVIADLTLIADELAPFELLVLQKEMSMQEIMEYLSLIGFWENTQRTCRQSGMGLAYRSKKTHFLGY